MPGVLQLTFTCALVVPADIIRGNGTLPELVGKTMVSDPEEGTSVRLISKPPGGAGTDRLRLNN